MLQDWQIVSRRRRGRQKRGWTARTSRDHGDATRRLDREDVEGAAKTPEDGVGQRGIFRRPGGRQKMSVRSIFFLKAKLEVDGQRQGLRKDGRRWSWTAIGFNCHV